MSVRFFRVFAVAVVCGLALLLMAALRGPLGLSPGPARLSDAAQAMEFLARQRAYPGRDLPPSGYAEAFAFTREKMAAEPLAKTGGSVWQALGPLNIGGRTLCIAFNPQNPNTVWAGSASGGLWRSYTGGVGAQAWQRVDTGHPVLGVSSIAFAPGDSTTIYIGTGEVYSYSNTQGGLVDRLTRGSFGIGVLMSADGGEHWVKSLDWSYAQQRGVQVVKVDPKNPKTVWAGTTIGVFKSTDGGWVWRQANSIPMITDLVVHTAHPDTVIIAAGNLGSTPRGIYRSTDGGEIWTQLPLGTAAPSTYLGKALLGICESFPDVVYASIGNGGLGANGTWLIRSEDAGTTWVNCSTTDYASYQGWFSHDVAVHPEDPSRVIAVGIDVWKSLSYGAGLVKKTSWDSWYWGQVPAGGPEGPSYYSHADHHDVVFHPTNPDIIYLANDGGVFRSLDGGETFAGCNGGYQTQQFYPGFTSSTNEAALAIGGMQDNSTGIYTGSTDWTRVIGGDGACAGIDAVDDRTLYGSAQNLVMFRSRDGGINWTEITPPSHGTTSFVAPYCLGGPAEPEVIYAGRTVVFKSTNEGDTWTTTNSGYPLDYNPVVALEVSKNSSQVAYATTAPGATNFGGVFRTLDGGAWWDWVTGNLPNRYAVGLAIDPSDDFTVYVTYSGFGTSHVFRTEDAGNSWQDIGAGLPDVPTSAVIVDPLDPQNVYVGTDLGVYATVNAGVTWFPFNSGLPEAVMVMDLNISPVDRMLRIATHGNGAYQRPLLEPVSGTDGQPAFAGGPTLFQNAPNPFNPRTRIAFSLPRAATARVAVYDLAGRRLRVLTDRWRESGPHVVVWDGTDEWDRPQPSGIYLLRLEADGAVRTRRATLVR